MSGVAYERLSLLDKDRLSQMEDWLSRHVVDQEEAVAGLTRLVRAAKLGLDLNPQRPDGVFLFVGPTGVGKTELARCLAELLFGDKEKLIRIDMSEYMERISTSRLIGTAPGYVGYYDQNQLTDQVRKNPYCVILFDEVEKADPQVLNLFLQVFDAGRLTDGKGRTVRFHNATIIMTSNVGTHLFSKGRLGYGEGTRGRGGATRRSCARSGASSPRVPQPGRRGRGLQEPHAGVPAPHRGPPARGSRGAPGAPGEGLPAGTRGARLSGPRGLLLRVRCPEPGPRPAPARSWSPWPNSALGPDWDRATAVCVTAREGGVAIQLLLPDAGMPVEAALPEEESETERRK